MPAPDDSARNPDEPGEAQGLRGFFHGVVTRPVAVSMVFLAALVFGYVSYKRLALELMPDISYPTVTVRTVFEGAAPQEVESQISRPIEEALSTLDGLVQIESRSRAGSSDVVLGFDWGSDMGAAAQSIRENIQKTWLPQQADRPLVLRYDPSLDPFLRLALSIDAEAAAAAALPAKAGGKAAAAREGLPESPEGRLYLLRQLAEEEIKRDLEGMRGVAAVRVQGGLEREIRIEVREDWLAARAVTLEQVQQALASENINVAGGSIIEGDVEYLIRTLNEYATADELRSLQIRRADGVRVPLTDVAIVRESHKEREVISRLDGGEAVELEVFKEAGANVVDVARRVKLSLKGNGLPPEWGGTPGLEGTLPAGVRLTLLDDQAHFVESAIDNLWSTALLGGVFAIGVLFLFLRDFRTTAIIGLAIPISVVIGFAPLFLLDVSLNLMSLGGLALGVGMLVDNAVVVLESIHRYLEEGRARVEAAVRGVSDVASAVTASTMTTVAVFFPISFVEGVAGELFGDLSLAVVSSLVASLAVALVLVPVLAALELPDARALMQPRKIRGKRRLPRPASPRPGLARARFVRLRRPGGSLVAVLSRDPAQSRWAWLKRVGAVLRRRVISEPMAPLRAWAGTVRQRKWRVVGLPWVLARFFLHLGVGAFVSAFTLGTALAARVALVVGAVVVRPAARFAMFCAGRFQSVYGRFEASYHRHLPSALKRPALVLALAALSFVGAVGAVRALGTELIPELHQGRFTIEVALPVGTPLVRTSAVVADVERRVGEHPEVATVYTAVGVDKRADSRADEGDHTARLRVQLVDGGDLAVREARVMEELRATLAEVPRLDARMVRPALFSFRTPVEVVLYGYDLDELRQTGDAVAERLSAVGGLRDVKSSLVRGHPEVRIHYDRDRLHRLGLDPNSVAQRVRDKVQGIEATRIRQGEQRVALRVQLVEQHRATLQDLQRINVNPNLTPVIPLSAVADFEEAVGPSEIRRVDQQRAVVVSANLEGFDLGTVTSKIESALAGLQLPDDVTWTVAGQSREMESSLASLQFALALALFLVYVIMASTFENLVHPFVILFTVPLAAVGAVGGLVIMGSSISVVVLIGVIVLAGVVVNNAIVLVDTINRLRAEGLGRDAAVRKAGRIRMRPILITTATTVLGLAPLALGFGAGAEMQGPLAITVIGGLSSATLLTLVVIPVVYSAFSFERGGAPAPAPRAQVAPGAAK